MKMFYLVCNISSLQQIQEIVDTSGCRDYQILDRVTGKMKTGEPRFNDSVWPGYNAVVIGRIEPDGLDKLKTAILRFNDEIVNENERATLTVWQPELMI
jgi:hypothetical protein